MSLGHTEPITQKHTLQKHPRKESSGLDLKDFRLQEVLRTAGDFSKKWCGVGSGTGFRSQVCAPRLMWEHGRESEGFEGKEHWCPILTSLPHPPPWHQQLPIASDCNSLFEGFSGHQSFFCPLARQIEEPRTQHWK